MKLFIAFLLLCFLAGMIGPVDRGPARLGPALADRRVRWFVAALAVALMVGYYVFNRI